MIRYIIALSLFIQIAVAGIEKEPNDSFVDAQEIFSNDEMIGERLKGEYFHDYYTFIATKQSFKLLFSTQEEQISYTIYLYNKEHKEIGRYRIAKGGGSLERIVGVHEGRIYIKIYGANSTNSRGTYQLEIDAFENSEDLDLYEIEPNNTLATSRSILLNKIYNGYRERGESTYDFYKLNNVNNSLSLHFSTKEEYIKFYIRVYDQYRNEVKKFTIPIGELEFNTSFVAPLGSLYIRIYGYNSTDSSGLYQVSLNSLSEANCEVVSLISNVVHNGSWNDSCLSSYRSGAYAKSFSFKLNSAKHIDISLDSNKDTYLNLIDKSGNNIAFNDDRGDGSTNSRINMFLKAGEYKIEATTYYPSTLGDFSIKYSAK